MTLGHCKNVWEGVRCLSETLGGVWGSRPKISQDIGGPPNTPVYIHIGSMTQRNSLVTTSVSCTLASHCTLSGSPSVPAGILINPYSRRGVARCAPLVAPHHRYAYNVSTRRQLCVIDIAYSIIHPRLRTQVAVTESTPRGHVRARRRARRHLTMCA
jgi:hypothetical protein